MFIRQQTVTCSVVFGNFRLCGTVIYRVRYDTVRCIHLVIPLYDVTQPKLNMQNQNIKDFQEYFCNRFL